MEILLFMLISYGICNIIIYGSIFNWFRNYLKFFGEGEYSLYKLFTCFMCLSFWVGLILTFIYNHFGYIKLTPMCYIGVENTYMIFFFNAVLTSACVWLIHTFQESLEN